MSHLYFAYGSLFNQYCEQRAENNVSGPPGGERSVEHTPRPLLFSGFALGCQLRDHKSRQVTVRFHSIIMKPWL